MYDDAAYRLHGPVELGEDGYPFAWQLVKHEVREREGNRCIRCGHPYVVGQEAFYDTVPKEESVQEVAALALFDMEPTDEPRAKRDRPIHWSPCDALCTHGGLVRTRSLAGWAEYDGDAGPLLLLSAVEKQAAWRILTVHHFDGNKANLRWWNLGALCQRCHLSVQSRVVMDRVYPLEHSRWFRLYVAGFYAFRYRDEELTREETEPRIEELLALERVA